MKDDVKMLNEATTTYSLPGLFSLLTDANGNLLKAAIGAVSNNVVSLTLFPSYQKFNQDGIYDGAQDYDYFKALLAWTKTYSNKNGGVFIGRVNPNSEGMAMMFLYNEASSSDLPKYSAGIYITFHRIYWFGTDNGVYKFRSVSATDISGGVNTFISTYYADLQKGGSRDGGSKTVDIRCDSAFDSKPAFGKWPYSRSGCCQITRNLPCQTGIFSNSHAESAGRRRMGTIDSSGQRRRCDSIAGGLFCRELLYENQQGFRVMASVGKHKNDHSFLTGKEVAA